MLLKQTAAAEYLGVLESFLEKRRVYGGGPRFAKIGRGVAYRRADLDAWIESRLRESTSEAAA
jgi:predicted DNA-binding transcriptional regulator AlpA